MTGVASNATVPGGAYARGLFTPGMGRHRPACGATSGRLIGLWDLTMKHESLQLSLQKRAKQSGSRIETQTWHISACGSRAVVHLDEPGPRCPTIAGDREISQVGRGRNLVAGCWNCCALHSPITDQSWDLNLGRRHSVPKRKAGVVSQDN